MDLTIEQSESLIRVSVFAGVFLLMLMFETLLPKKQRVMPRTQRWITNISLLVFNGLLVRLLLPVLAIAVAELSSQHNIGLLAFISMPSWLKIITAIILLDFLIYLQHLASHTFSMLWRFHRIHHLDRDIDVTTGIRFHPLEILFSMLFKVLCVVLIGAPVVAVFIFEIILNAAAMFNHANVRIPLKADKIIRKFIVTPDMHRVHHSTKRQETDSNYGFFISAWDRLFNTYTDQPRAGHEAMVIGLEQQQDDKPASFLWCLILPFKSADKTPKN